MTVGSRKLSKDGSWALQLKDPTGWAWPLRLSILPAPTANSTVTQVALDILHIHISYVHRGLVVKEALSEASVACQAAREHGERTRTTCMLAYGVASHKLLCMQATEQLHRRVEYERWSEDYTSLSKAPSVQPWRCSLYPFDKAEQPLALCSGKLGKQSFAY